MINKLPTKEIYLVIDVTLNFKYGNPNKGFIIKIPYCQQSIKEIEQEIFQYLNNSSGNDVNQLTHITINEIVKCISKTQYTPYLQGSYELDVLNATGC